MSAVVVTEVNFPSPVRRQIVTDQELQKYLIDHNEKILERWSRFMDQEEVDILTAATDLYQTDLEVVSKLNKFLQ